VYTLVDQLRNKQLQFINLNQLHRSFINFVYYDGNYLLSFVDEGDTEQGSRCFAVSTAIRAYEAPGRVP
jgi:hypothetical protein